MSGQLIGIARASDLGAPMELLETATIDTALGVVGDARGRKLGRQITVLSREGWLAACREVAADLPWTTRRANLLVDGLELPRSVGSTIKVGSVVLEVTMETAPCQLMERAHTGLRSAMAPDWRGGVCCSVRSGGEVRLGDRVTRAD